MQSKHLIFALTEAKHCKCNGAVERSLHYLCRHRLDSGQTGLQCDDSAEAGPVQPHLGLAWLPTPHQALLLDKVGAGGSPDLLIEAGVLSLLVVG